MTIQMVNDYQIHHDGNHNETGNPHRQYGFPLVVITPPTAIGQYTKIMSTYPIPNAYKPYLYLKGDIVSYGSTNAGQLILHITPNGNGTYTTRQFTVENYSYPVNFFLYQRTIDANTFCFDLYMQSAVVGDPLKFIPTVCDFSPNKDWVAFKFPISQQGGASGYINFLSNQSYVSSISDSLIASSAIKQTPIKALQYVTNSITSGSTIDATNLGTAMLNYSVATNVTGFTNYVEGQIITLHALNGNATLVHSGSSFSLKGGASVTLTAGQNVTMRRIQSLFAEIGRNF